MMRLLVIFIVLIGSGWLGVQLSRDPGYLLIAINHWTLETTLWVAIFAIIIIFFLLYFLIQLIASLIRSPASFQAWLAKRQAQKAQAATRKGFIEYSEGYWQKAKNHLIKALPNTDTPLLNYLTAARAAQKMGDHTLRDQYLREAQRSMPEAKIAVELTQAELQLANHQWEQALATLMHLKDLAPHHPYVLKLLMNLFEEVKDWPQLIALLPEIKKYQIISPAQLEHLKIRAHYHAIKELAKYDHEKALSELMENLPKDLYYNPELNAEYCRFLLRIEKQELAESVLRRCLRKVYNDELIELYGLCKANPEQQLLFAESLLKKSQHSTALYLCLGRLSLESQLWGKAQNYLDKSIELHPKPESYAALGHLYEQLNEPFKASQSYKRGLELVGGVY